jgi:hypothetical protein
MKKHLTLMSLAVMCAAIAAYATTNHQPAWAATCTSQYTYRSPAGTISEGLLSYPGTITVAIKEKGFYDSKTGEWLSCAEYHANVTICASAGHTIPSESALAWTAKSNDPNNPPTHYGNRPVTLASIAGGTCRTFSSYDAGFAPGTEIYASGEFDNDGIGIVDSDTYLIP